jgi:hypothetical protein
MMKDPHWGDEMAASAWNPDRITASPAGQMAAAAVKAARPKAPLFPAPVQRAEVRYEPLPTGEATPRRLSWGQWYVIFFVLAVIFGGRS